MFFVLCRRRVISSNVIFLTRLRTAVGLTGWPGPVRGPGLHGPVRLPKKTDLNLDMGNEVR